MTEQIARLGRTLAALLALLAAVWGAPALAHLTPNSEVRLDFVPGGVRAEAIVPQAEYAYATGLPADNRAASLEKARAYLAQRIAAVAPDGRRWRLSIEDVRFEQREGPPDLIAQLALAPPPGADERRLRLEWRVVTPEAPSHFALAVVRSDLAAGLSEGRQLLGALTAARPVLSIDRVEGSAWGLFASAFALGVKHIAEGYDHLLFLLALMLPAPLMARAGRWAEPRPPRRVMASLGWIVTAFTLGHSATLVLAAVLGARLPVAPVEAAIALSVLVSAIHAWRPLFAGREPLVGAAFGTVHGLAFATLLSGYALGSRVEVSALAGFNLGIEAVQIALVLAALPALIVLGRSAAYAKVRTVIAAMTGVAALAWLAERVGGGPNPLAAAAEAVLPWLGAAIAALSLLVIARAVLGAARSRAPA